MLAQTRYQFLLKTLTLITFLFQAFLDSGTVQRKEGANLCSVELTGCREVVLEIHEYRMIPNEPDQRSTYST